MKQALDALESIWVYGADTLSGPARGQPDDRKFQRDGVAEMTKRARLGKEALRQAIETAEKQEPDELTIAYMTGFHAGKNTPQRKPDQEPVAYWNFNSGFSHCMIDQLNEAAKHNPAPLYTHPPKREWVSLTDFEIDQIYCDHHDNNGDPISLGYERALEAKLWEKNKC